MGSRNYIILSEDLTPTKRENLRLKALAAGVIASIDNNIGTYDRSEIPIANPKTPSLPDFAATIEFLRTGAVPDSLDIREFQPTLDAGATIDQWNTVALGAVGTEVSIFFGAAVPPAIGLRIKKLVVWYKVQILTVPMPVSRLVFRRTNAAGTVMAQFDLQQLASGQKLDGYLSEPVIWKPSLPYVINVQAKGMPAVSTGLVAEVAMGAFVFEPGGSTNQ